MLDNHNPPAMSLADFYSQFPNAEKHIDLEHEPRPFHFELPPHLTGLHSGFSMQEHHGLKKESSQKRAK